MELIMHFTVFTSTYNIDVSAEGSYSKNISIILVLSVPALYIWMNNVYYIIVYIFYFIYVATYWFSAELNSNTSKAIFVQMEEQCPYLNIQFLSM